MPLGANERVTLWQTARRTNEGVGNREPRKVQDALATLREMARAGSRPIDTAAVPPEALSCTDDDLWIEVHAFCLVFGPRLRAEA